MNRTRLPVLDPPVPCLPLLDPLVLPGGLELIPRHILMHACPTPHSTHRIAHPVHLLQARVSSIEDLRSRSFFHSRSTSHLYIAYVYPSSESGPRSGKHPVHIFHRWAGDVKCRVAAKAAQQEAVGWHTTGFWSSNLLSYVVFPLHPARHQARTNSHPPTPPPTQGP